MFGGKLLFASVPTPGTQRAKMNTPCEAKSFVTDSQLQLGR